MSYMDIDEAIDLFVRKRNSCVCHTDKRAIDLSAEEHEQIAEWLEELKIFKELYPDADVKGSLVKNYNNGWNDCLKFLSEHLEEFHNTLQAGQYDYFPDDDILKWFNMQIKG